MPVLPIDTGRYGTVEMLRVFEEEARLLDGVSYEMSGIQPDLSKCLAEPVARQLAGQHRASAAAPCLALEGGLLAAGIGGDERRRLVDPRSVASMMSLAS